MEPTTEIIKRTKRLKIELGIYAGLFIVSFCFPAFTFFYGEDGSRIEPQYIWNSPFMFVFILELGLV